MAGSGGERRVRVGEERSRRPARSPTRVSDAMAARILTMRESLVARRLFCGAQAIAWELEERRSRGALGADDSSGAGPGAGLCR